MNVLSINCFVYSLVDDNNQVFYIGYSRNLAARYRYHIMTANKSTTATAKRITCILQFGKYPDLRIIDYLPLPEAILRESELIKLMATMGQTLTNHQFNFCLKPAYNIYNYNNHLDIIKIVDYRQQDFIRQHKERINRINGIREYIPCPESPKLSKEL